MRWPSIQVGDQPGQCLPSVRIEAPSISRRGTARISAMVMSAVSSVSTFGVLVTVMPRACAAVTSILSTPLPKLAIMLQLAVGLLEQLLGDLVGDGRHQHVGGAHRLGDLLRRHRRIVEIEPRVEQFAHAGLDRVRQLARDDDERLFLNRHVLLSMRLVQTSLTRVFDTAACRAIPAFPWVPDHLPSDLVQGNFRRVLVLAFRPL